MQWLEPEDEFGGRAVRTDHNVPILSGNGDPIGDLLIEGSDFSTTSVKIHFRPHKPDEFWQVEVSESPSIFSSSTIVNDKTLAGLTGFIEPQLGMSKIKTTMNLKSKKIPNHTQSLEILCEETPGMTELFDNLNRNLDRQN